MKRAELESLEPFTFVRRLVRDRAAILLDESKNYLIEARLLPVARAEGHAGLAGLVRALQRPGSDDLAKVVVEAMTTNETSFFRDIAPFDCLKHQILPELIAARGEARRLHVWCAAASSGQEPYGITFLLHDSLPASPKWQVEVLATDISAKMVQRTRDGSFSQMEVNRGLPAKMLANNFERRGLRWVVKEEFRSMLRVEELNLIDPWPALPTMDIIFLRNVLIYFDVPTKRSILRRIQKVMAPDGFLFLGGAETTVGVVEGFERVDFANASCYRLCA